MKKIIPLVSLLLATQAPNLGNSQEIEILQPKTQQATNLEEALHKDNNNSYSPYYFGSEMGIQGRKVNLVVEGKYYSVNADELPEYDEEGNMKLMEWRIGPKLSFTKFYKGEYMDPNKNYSDDMKEWLWYSATEFLLRLRKWHIDGGRYEKAKTYDEEIAKAFGKTLFFLDKKNLINFRYNYNWSTGEVTEWSTPLRSFENTLEGFIAQIATEAYETLDYIEPNVTLEDIERRYVKPHQPVSGFEDGSKLLAELGVSWVDEFVQRNFIHKDKIDRDKISIEQFKEYKIFEYQQKIIRDLQKHLQSLSTDELLLTLATEEEFVENLTMPLWSKYLSCSPKWAATVIAASELDYFLRIVNYPEKKNYNFTIDEIDKFTNLNMYTLLVGRRFNCDDYIEVLSKKPAIICRGADRIYDSIEKQKIGNEVYAFPKDRHKVDELKRKQPGPVDLPDESDSPFHGQGFLEIYQKYIK